MTKENWVLEFSRDGRGWGTFLLDSLEYEHCFRKMKERMDYEEVLAQSANTITRFIWRMRELDTNEIIMGDIL